MSPVLQSAPKGNGMSTPTSFTWQPSNTRVVVVGGFGPFPRGTLQTAPPPLAWPVKDPGDVLDYVVDFSAALAGNGGDSIAGLNVTIAPGNTGDLSLNSSSADGDLAILWLSAGIAGTTYAVTVVASTNSGRTLSRTVSLRVAALAVAAASGTDITDQSGAPVTDQTGAPLTTS
jgi:hypothetical protein